MTVFVDSTTGLVDETPCAGCGWPVCSCLCEDGDLVNWQARAEAADAERDALREQCIEWLPFTEAAQDCQGSLLVWREDAGTFVAFYNDDARCWFTERGEDLTGDLPAYYAKMPQGPTSK